MERPRGGSSSYRLRELQGRAGAAFTVPARSSYPVPVDPTFAKAYAAIPMGACEGRYGSRRYAITKTAFAGGQSHKLYAEQLGGTHFVSFNLYWVGSPKAALKPCEMLAQEVIDFVLGVEIMRS